jgi:hypothetical protein
MYAGARRPLRLLPEREPPEPLRSDVEKKRSKSAIKTMRSINASPATSSPGGNSSVSTSFGVCSCSSAAATGCVANPMKKNTRTIPNSEQTLKNLCSLMLLLLIIIEVRFPFNDKLPYMSKFPACQQKCLIYHGAMELNTQQICTIYLFVDNLLVGSRN